jgi:hypothetical protein
MKKTIYLLGIATSMLITSCGGSYYVVQPAGELTMISTRNVETKTEYSKLKTYAGIDRSQVDNAIATSKGGKISVKSPVYKEINTYKAKNLQESVDAVVKSVVGGEFLKNAKMYSVIQYVKSNVPGQPLVATTFYMASGDVWGTKSEDDNIKGFRKGDQIIFTYTKENKKLIGKVFEGELNSQYQGKILELKSASAMISLATGEVVELPYTSLTKIE